MLSGRSTKHVVNLDDRCESVWCLSDGRAGHRRQIEGLVQQLADRREMVVHWVPVEGVANGEFLRGWMTGRFPLGDELPDPQLIVGAGHSTHLAALAARRARGGKVVMLMRPSLPTRLFDLCLVPEHDLESVFSRIDRSRVIPTRGVLNPFVPSADANPSQALILIGGPSRHHGWSDEAILRQLRQLIELAPPHMSWTLTTSRRTPDSLLKPVEETIVSEPGGPQIQFIPFAQTGSHWLAERLADSGTVFVTEDSVSMVYEALTVGADVGLIDVPRLHAQSRNARCIDRIVAENLAIPLSEWQRTRFENRKRETFNEASRCANIVCQELLDAA